jgi:enoyl-CoA hydratase
MSQYTTLLFENNCGIGMITLNRPKVLNALNYKILKELDSLLDLVAQDETIKVVIITGSGEKSFVAGADISEMRNLSAPQGREWGKFGQSVFNRIETLPQPVIAAVNGYALGGGCELAMACDMRIVSEKAKFGQPEVGLGVIPGFAGTQRLPRLIGRGRAKELLFTGDIINAEEAYRIGLANKVTTAEELIDTAKAVAEKIMSRAEVAVRLCKSAVNVGMNIDIQSGTAYEAETFGLCFATRDQKEGMTAFLEKRKALFIGKYT